MLDVRGRLDPYPADELREVDVVTLSEGTELDMSGAEPEETGPDGEVPVPVAGTVLFVSGKGTDAEAEVDVGNTELIGPPVPVDPGTKGVVPVPRGTVELSKG